MLRRLWKEIQRERKGGRGGWRHRYDQPKLEEATRRSDGGKERNKEKEKMLTS